MLPITYNPKELLSRQVAIDGHNSIRQMRKYSTELFYHHPLRVGDRIKLYGLSSELVCAGNMHDLLEDVTKESPYYNIHLIHGGFGPLVTVYVVDVTNVFTKDAFPNLNRVQRKGRERERIGGINPESKALKVFDIEDNIRYIMLEDPGFGRTFLKEKLLLMQYLQNDFNEPIWGEVNLKIKKLLDS